MTTDERYRLYESITGDRAGYLTIDTESSQFKIIFVETEEYKQWLKETPEVFL